MADLGADMFEASGMIKQAVFEVNYLVKNKVKHDPIGNFKDGSYMGYCKGP